MKNFSNISLSITACFLTATPWLSIPIAIVLDPKESLFKWLFVFSDPDILPHWFIVVGMPLFVFLSIFTAIYVQHTVYKTLLFLTGFIGSIVGILFFLAALFGGNFSSSSTVYFTAVPILYLLGLTISSYLIFRVQ